MRWSPGLPLVLVMSFALACAEKGVTTPDASPLTGLVEAQGNDSTGAPPPPPTNPASPGFVIGTVLGPSDPGAGNDSLQTAPRVAGVVVTAYPKITPSAGDSLGIGQAVATVTTGADGKFQLPTLPGGEYWVTFEPPANSIYGGVWVWGPIHDKTNEWPWWIVLWKKG